MIEQQQNQHHHQQQSSLLPVDNDLINRIISSLPEEEFLKLISFTLNMPLSEKQIKEFGITTGGDVSAAEELNLREYWIEEYLTDELFLQLAETKMIVKRDGDGKSIAVHKYYNQASRLLKWIPIAKPAPEFIVNMSDLNVRIIAELKTLDDPQYVLKQAVGRIFENIDPRQYHLSIARKLKVVLQS